MARKLFAIIVAGVLAFHVQKGLGQDNPPPPDPGRPADGAQQRPILPPNRPFRQGVDFEGARRLFEQLPPDDKQRVKENLKRWMDMTPEEREAMRVRDQQRRQKMLQDIDETIRKSGLKLDADQRQVYVLRYTQERRKIEQKLRQEMEDKRKPMLDDMVERLKTEFGASASPSPSAKP